MGTKIVVDCATGESKEVEQTREEIAKADEDRAAAIAAEAEPAPPTDLERLVAVLVTKVDALTEADVAKALGVHEDRVAAASAEMAKERTR